MKENFTFSITGYKGYEEEVLQLRNNNRPKPQTRTHMDWRYLGQYLSMKPLIFWIHNSKGARVGMASLIFRPYWVSNKIYDFAVLGDIALNKELRGKGIAKKLFLFINSHIEKQLYPCALVIPNEAARKSLSSAGWKVQEELPHYVNLFSPSDKIYSIIKNRMLSDILGLTFKLIKTIRLSFSPTKGLTATVVNKFDESINLLWESMKKKN